MHLSSYKHYDISHIVLYITFYCRYLPEYRELRTDFAQFFEICRSPDLAATASLQPLERFETLDAGNYLIIHSLLCIDLIP